MFDRIVVGTDGSETATEAVRTAVELAKLSGAKLEIVSAYEPVPQQRLRDEGEGISGDISYTVNPREDVELVLGNAAAVAKSLDDFALNLDLLVACRHTTSSDG